LAQEDGLIREMDGWFREMVGSWRWVAQGDGRLREIGGSERWVAQGDAWLAQGDGLNRELRGWLREIGGSGRWVAKLVERLLAAAALLLRIQTRHKKSQMATATLVRQKTIKVYQCPCFTFCSFLIKPNKKLTNMDVQRKVAKS